MLIGANNNFSPGFDIEQFRKQSGGGGIDNQVSTHGIVMLPCDPRRTLVIDQRRDMRLPRERHKADRRRHQRSGPRRRARGKWHHHLNLLAYDDRRPLHSQVAMGCNARVCTTGTRLGLPELSLGILPGFGGTQARGNVLEISFSLSTSETLLSNTQRLPRLVGLKKSVEMMLTSQVEGRSRGRSFAAAVPAPSESPLPHAVLSSPSSTTSP